MSEGNYVKTALIHCSYASLSLLAFASALSGVLGTDAQTLAFGCWLVLAGYMAVFCVGLVILSDWSRARTDFYRRQALSGGSEAHLSSGGIDADANKLRSTLKLMQQDEDSYVERYAQRHCSLEDVIHAKALRVQAEIDMIRQEKRPKSWAEVCAEYHACQH